mgnify:CR=1 FL=1
MNVDLLIIGIFLFIVGLVLFPIGLSELKENLKDVNELSLWRKFVVFAVELWGVTSLTSYLSWILCLSLIFLFSGILLTYLSF